MPWSTVVYASWTDGTVTKLSADAWKKRGEPKSPAPVRYVKTRWSDARYALVTFPHTPRDRAVDLVVVVTASRYAAAGRPSVATVSHVPTSTYFRYASSSVDRYVRTPDGERHKLTAAQYERAGSPKLTVVYGGYYRTKWAKSDIYFVSRTGAKKLLTAKAYAAAGKPRVASAPTVFVKTRFSPVHALVTWPHAKGDRSVDEVVRLTAQQYAALGKPATEIRMRIPGDSFVRLTIGDTIYHRSQGYLTPVTTAQWRAAGAPKVRTVAPRKPMYIRDILIVNKSLPLPSSFGNGLRPELTKAFAKMRAAARDDGVDLRIISGFRSYASQKAVYAAKIRQYGFEKAERRSARPGHSEHQTGLAIDVNSISQSWGETRAGRWVAKNAHRFGFIVRYPKGKTSKTGYSYEPWHLRHVGVAVATHLSKNKLTLDEYLGVPSAY
ncbi:MAG: D-alanyl-D-alanine carboxypeptidase family protein [Microbacterium sp.]|nr:MAG: D-alanyl-D-alanine carboxypeptidase family protein [Microbacterium sp.]